ncbi:Sb-PDE family phosphodiesterase [Parabacteroides sp. AM08-6]|uniref:Sb-PDE family phosphodiesterase n=1 Tax=Parabacteroides sp. AM08-6 TaxID=2292053 RepID=UPI000F00F67E|nr:Sb-PDE family phosphodiesterase [Parabacteroides sp. AM08-6]RHJ86476.1 histidinol-phosphatase [Parabacteroides sp. AM08-6]
MKKVLVSIFILALCLSAQAQVRNEVHIPDLKGYQTLKCDFHIHTVFSDGTVWPTVRIDEAYREGLDAISLTEHIEYRPHKKDIKASHNRSFEIAESAAKSKNILLIKGSEITRSMPPGHSNAIFLKDADALEQEDYRDAFKAAKNQGAFIFWNHPGWDAQQPDTTLWWKEHTELLEDGCLKGIEVVNGKYFPEAHQWCLDKKMTMLGNSDVHQPIQVNVDFGKGEHRTMTLVFAKERSVEGIREALENRRTAVYFKENLIGEPVYLKELFENSIRIENVKKTDKEVHITLFNDSDLKFVLKKTEQNPNLQYFRDYTIQPHCKHTIVVKLLNGTTRGSLNFEVTNLWVQPGKGLAYSFAI